MELREKRGAANKMVHREKKLIIMYLENYWPCAGGFSAVNAIGTQQLHDLIPYLGIDPMMAV